MTDTHQKETGEGCGIIGARGDAAMITVLPR